MRRRPALVLTALLVLVLAACGGAQESSPDPEPGPPASPQTAAALAGTLPDIDPTQSLVLHFGDVGAIAEANDVPVPVDGDVESLLAWARTGLADVPILLPSQLGPERLADHDQYAAELGVSLWQTQRYASVEAAPRRLTVLQGDLDERAVTDALGEPADGVWSAGGDELEVDLDDRTVARPLGEALRLGLRGDDQVVLATTEKLIGDAIDGRSTVREDEALAAALDALDSDELVSGLVIRGPVDDDLVVNGAAFGGGPDGVVGRMVFGYADEDAAEEAVDDVEAYFTQSAGRWGPWSERLTVDAVAADGRLVVVDVSFTEEQQPQSVVQLISAFAGDLPQAQ